MLHVDTYRILKQKIIIKECHEKILEIPKLFARFTPHPYLHVDAPYGSKSPFYLRSTVIEHLHVAQEKLSALKAGYKLKIFDAYRPLEVQKYMIEYDTLRYSKEIAEKFWSPISCDVASNPPPHSTGGALDLTIVDENGIELNMGTNIDEFVEAAQSDFNSLNATCRENRDLLFEVMNIAGFTSLPTEWWHFSYGDQIWAVDEADKNSLHVEAKYGMI
jgi:D-alanyl-D-alanine dipeptidase